MLITVFKECFLIKEINLMITALIKNNFVR